MTVERHVILPGRTGGARVYVLARQRPGVWTITGGERPYRLTEDGPGWRCECEAFKFGAHPCKHGLALEKELKAMAEEAKPKAAAGPTLEERLAEPFEPTEVKWKPQLVRNSRALACAYVDARVVEDRLDAIFGVAGWQDSYQPLENGAVMCRLRVRVGQEWIEKSDVGGQSDQPDEGDRTKSAFSDALKRAAVKLGIGRYLYRLPSVWVDYDPQTRQLKTKPQLPGWAIPKGQKAPAPQSAPKKADRPPAGETYIPKDLAGKVRGACVAAGLDVAKVLAKYRANDFTDIPTSKLDELRRAVKGKPAELLAAAAAGGTDQTPADDAEAEEEYPIA